MNKKIILIVLGILLLSTVNGVAVTDISELVVDDQETVEMTYKMFMFGRIKDLEEIEIAYIFTAVKVSFFVIVRLDNSYQWYFGRMSNVQGAIPKSIFKGIIRDNFICGYYDLFSENDDVESFIVFDGLNDVKNQYKW